MDYSLIIDGFYLYSLVLFLNEYFSRKFDGKMLNNEDASAFEKKIEESSFMLKHPFFLKKKNSKNSIILKNTVIKGSIKRSIPEKFIITRFRRRLKMLNQDYMQIPKNLTIKNNIDLSFKPDNIETPIRIIKSNSNIQISKSLFECIQYGKKEKKFKIFNLCLFSLSVGLENECVFPSSETTYIICDLVYNIPNKLFTIKNPLLIAKSISDQVSLAKLQNRIFEKKSLIMLLCTVFYVEYRFWKMRNLRRVIKRIADLFKEDVLHKRLKPNEDANCIICLAKPREIIIKPCGHLVCCEQCSSMLNECPICRKAIIGIVIVVNESKKA